MIRFELKRFALGAVIASAWVGLPALGSGLTAEAQKQLESAVTLWKQPLNGFTEEQFTTELGPAEYQDSGEGVRGACYRTQDGLIFAPLKGMNGAGYSVAREETQVSLELGHVAPKPLTAECVKVNRKLADLIDLSPLRLGMSRAQVEKLLGAPTDLSGTGPVVQSTTYRTSEKVSEHGIEFQRDRRMMLDFKGDKLVAFTAYELLKN